MFHSFVSLSEGKLYFLLVLVMLGSPPQGPYLRHVLRIAILLSFMARDAHRRQLLQGPWGFNWDFVGFKGKFSWWFKGDLSYLYNGN